MTRWYPVPVPLGSKVIFKVYNSEGHFIADACDEATATHIADLHNAELRVTEITDEDYGWIPWHGGEMPVPEGTLVDVKHRNGDILPKRKAGMGVYPNHGAGHQYWKHEADPSDIIAYRLAEPRQDEPVATVNLSDHEGAFTIGADYKILECDREGVEFYDNDGNRRFRGWQDADWQLLYPGKVYAQAPERIDASDFTPFKCYEVIDDGEADTLFMAYNDMGLKSFLCWDGEIDARIPSGLNWTRIIPEEI